MARIQFTFNTDGMTSLESLVKDVIPSVLEVNCIGFLQQTTPKLQPFTLKLAHSLSLRVEIMAVKRE